MENKYNKLLTSCNYLIKILAKYYSFYNEESIDSYVIPSSENIAANCGQTLFEENYENNEIFIGIQFGENIIHEVENSSFISLNSLAVLSEEISHFKCIVDSITLNSNISKLDIEMLGEIDRFICLMHWNQLKISPKLNFEWKNLHNICDLVFQGERFSSNNPLYIEAECLAFKHLKQAFSHDWDATNYDFSTVNNKAKNYLTKLRSSILKS